MGVVLTLLLPWFLLEVGVFRNSKSESSPEESCLLEDLVALVTGGSRGEDGEVV